MLSTTRLLLRLRRHGVPGPAPPAGVPVDRSAEMRTELAPVFAALQPTVDECRRREDEAARDAEDAVRRARAAAARILQDAVGTAPGLAAAEARREAGRLEQESRKVRAGAVAEAERIRVAAASRTGGLRLRMVEAVLALPRGEAP